MRFTSRWRERKKAATTTEIRPNPMSSALANGRSSAPSVITLQRMSA